MRTYLGHSADANIDTRADHHVTADGEHGDGSTSAGRNSFALRIVSGTVIEVEHTSFDVESQVVIDFAGCGRFDLLRRILDKLLLLLGFRFGGLDGHSGCGYRHNGRAFDLLTNLGRWIGDFSRFAQQHGRCGRILPLFTCSSGKLVK